MAIVPVAEAKPQVSVYFDAIPSRDWGFLYSEFEFKAMLNGGYIVRATFTDPQFNMLTELVNSGYLQNARSRVLKMRFQIRWGSVNEALPTEKATTYQTANVISVVAKHAGSDMAELEFVGIDPASWALNTGNASGRCYKGKVSQVIKQVISEYAPDIELDISETTDSNQNKFWMMRQDPKSFISSLLDWSSSVTQQKTNWIIAMDGNRLSIKEQASFRSTQRAFYRYWDGPGVDTIADWELLSNNALSIVETKIVTQGLSAISGQYLDRSMDEDEKIVFAKDSTTSGKIIAQTDAEKSFAKPDDSPGSTIPNVGWTAVPAIPEIYSGGELGLRYDQYIDGRPRGMFLNMINSLMRMRMRVIGHGEWTSCLGLGVDTVFIKWMAEPKPDQRKLYFLSGNWIIYGFHHIVTRRQWSTDVYIARYDYNAVATKVGGSEPTSFT